MQTRNLRLTLVFFLTLAVCRSTHAQSVGRIESMKLLTTDIGWAATRNKLLWTTDGGASWKDITPNTARDRTITSATFSDESHGWVLLAHRSGDDPQTGFGKTLFDLARTADAGTSWSVKELTVPNPDPERGFSEQTWLDFVDALHGWVLLRANGNTAMGGGALAATDDGGATWKALGVIAAGPIRFVTIMDGWLDGEANGEAGPGLYVTRNGGKDWEPVALNAPPSFGAKVYPTYGLPEFANKDAGSMLVTFAQPNDKSPELALFLTRDGGRTWSLIGSSQEGRASWRTAYIDGQLLAAGCPSREFTLLRSSSAGISANKISRAASGAPCSNAGASISQISFANDMHGWLLSFGGDLLATSNGGYDWSTITPLAATTASPLSRKSAEMPPRGRSSSAPAPFVETPSAGVSTHLGFDKFPVIPTTSDMQTWMTSSPFYDVGIYLPGSKNKSIDPNLTPAWASAIQNQQGWGIMPLWFGLQSSCACYVSKGQCVAFTNQINNNTTQAAAQGVAEAKAAINSAQTLGVSPAIIYKDIENYYTSVCNSSQQSAAALAVRAYVGGWDQQMHTVGLAGVYGNPAPASQDFTKASPIPDDVWVAKYTSPPQLTIWALGTLADAPNWTNEQRIHQCRKTWRRDGRPRATTSTQTSKTRPS